MTLSMQKSTKLLPIYPGFDSKTEFNLKNLSDFERSSGAANKRNYTCLSSESYCSILMLNWLMLNEALAACVYTNFKKGTAVCYVS